MSGPIKIRAGKCTRLSGTSTVEPQPSRGYITLQEEDGLWNFTYTDLSLTPPQSDDPLILLPDDATFTRLPSSVTAGRVYKLALASSGATLFFWMQDPRQETDRDVERAFQDILGENENENEGEGMEVDEPAPAPPSQAPTTTQALPSHSGPDSASTDAHVPSSQPVQFTSDNLAAIRRALGLPSAPSSGGSGSNSLAHGPSYTLPDVLPSSLLLPHLSSLSSSHSTLKELYTHLPPSLPHTPASLRSVVSSPDFRRSAGALDRALRMGVLAGVVSMWGLKEEEGMGVETFLQGVERSVREEGEREGRGGGGGGGGGGDEKMSG